MIKFSILFQLMLVEISLKISWKSNKNLLTQKLCTILIRLWTDLMVFFISSSMSIRQRTGLFLMEIYFLVMFFIVLIGIIGNASIIIIILRNKVLRLQPTNLFLLNMALSDSMNLCITPALYLFKRDVLFTNYYLGKICCFMSPFFTGKSKLTLHW